MLDFIGPKSQKQAKFLIWCRTREAINNAVELALELIQAPQRRYGALLDAPGLIPVGLDQLDVAARAGGRDLDKHAATLSQESPVENKI